MSTKQIQLPHQTLSPSMTTWHITWGTYAARLHGGNCPTVSRRHNEIGDPFVEPNPIREDIALESLRGKIVHLTREQQLHSQETIPQLCIRGGWHLRTCSAAPDHIHVVLDVDPSVHGEKVRRLLKRWLGESLTTKFGILEIGTWWAKEGSNRAIHDEQYLNNAYGYVFRQRAA